MEVIATRITSLDQARYFAAMGADWIGFHGNAVSVETMQAIAEWVVGPAVFAEFTQLDEELLFEYIGKTPIRGICVPDPGMVPSWYEGRVIVRADPAALTSEMMMTNGLDHTWLLAMPDHPSIPEWCREKPCWMEIDEHHIDQCIERLGTLAASGLAIRCADVPDHTELFGQYDRIFEALHKLEFERGHDR